YSPMQDDRRPAIDVGVNTADREALAGTTPASLYRPLRERDQFSVAPDGRPSDAQPAWRSDFPIDWPQDHYVERRDFMKFMVLTSLAFTVGQFWIAAQDWLGRRRSAPEPARIAAASEIPVGGTRLFGYPTPHDPCMLVRTAETSFVAYSQKCTHLSCAVIPDVKAGVIRCPCHDGLFDLA